MAEKKKRIIKQIENCYTELDFEKMENNIKEKLLKDIEKDLVLIEIGIKKRKEITKNKESIINKK